VSDHRAVDDRRYREARRALRRRQLRRRRRVGATASIAVAIAVSVGLLSAFNPGRGHTAFANHHREHPDTVVTVNPDSVVRPVPSGFVGLSFEYSAVPWYTGSDPRAVNPVFEELVRNLAPGQSPSIRIGGNSTDTTWWPAAGIRRPPGVSYTLSRRWMSLTAALARDTGARLIMGIDLEAGVPALAVAEARAFLSRFGESRLRAFEIGNEAPRYGLFPWYHAGPGQPVLARRPSYSFQDFSREYATVAGRLPRSVPLAGPTLGGPLWMENLAPFVSSEPRLGLVSFHHYPFNRCFIPLYSPVYPTIPRLLSRSGSRGFESSLEQYIGIARAHGLPFRIDELNSVACGGKRGVSDRFASALWILDTLFDLVRIGVSGVNIHMFPGASYILFSFRRSNGHWVGRVRPEYYGLLLFAQATPPGSRLLGAITRGGQAVRAWATRGAKGTVRVVLINDGLHKRHVFLVRDTAGGGPATVIRLSAPSALARNGVTIGGQRFGRTSTGRLTAPPEQEPVSSNHGRYVIRLAPATAALLTIPAR
jgi:Glycosyl hydrolase family 79 C-terminal beta domain